ncbi:hypothetical protein [Streptomyces sp. NPDC008125]|uniref:hypothetical protein n=1 Tax=Streptomyces sp. NPDC008125 TaxID=3364811 RepID=UPI0036EDAF95
MVPPVVVLGVIGGAAVYTKSTVDSADRTSPTTLWSQENLRGSSPGNTKDPAAGAAAGRSDTELSRLLLPADSAWRLGMDIDKRGNDNVIDAREAAATIKKSAHGLSGKLRREFEKHVDRMRVEGVAQRSYFGQADDVVATVEIMKMKDKQAVHDTWSSMTGLTEAMQVFREGPKIKGHKNARCFRYPENDDVELDGVTCMAYDGEHYVEVTAEGPGPLSMSDIADLVKDQLDHIKSPGKYI